MKIKALIFLVLAAALPLAAPRCAQARADVSFDYFYDALEPYGEWIEVQGYGDCWRPTDVDPDWTPYQDGYWAFTNAGWTWVGYEEFAGIVYHYGRWVNVVDAGWCWVPDYEWGPAWVSWRKSREYIGWAPLPPRAHWQPEIGIGIWVDTEYDIGPDFYSFCRVRDFGAPVLRPVIIGRGRNFSIIADTVNITNITYNTHGDVPVIYNGGPSFAVVNSLSARPIPALKLVRTTHFDRPDFHAGPGRFSPNARTVGNQLIVNAPIVAPPVEPAFLQGKVKKTFAADKVASGWAGVKDGKVRDGLRQRFQRETKGLTPYSAPAKPVVAADLKVVPAQGDPNAASPAVTAGRGPRGKGDQQPAVTGAPVLPGKISSPATETPQAGKNAGASPAETLPADAGKAREKELGKSGGGKTPSAVTTGPLKPFNRPPSGSSEKAPTPTATVPPEVPPGGFHPPAGQQAIGGGAKPVKAAPEKPVGVDPATTQAEAEAARAAREKATMQQQKQDAEKIRAAQAEAEKSRGELERRSRLREAEAAANAQKKELEAQRQAELARKAELKRQQADAQALERQRQQEQLAAQRRSAELDQQKQAAAERAREKQIEQGRAAQEAAKGQAAEVRRQQQIEQQKAVSRAPQPPAQGGQAPAVQDPKHGAKDKDKDKDKDKPN